MFHSSNLNAGGKNGEVYWCIMDSDRGIINFLNQIITISIIGRDCGATQVENDQTFL